MAGALSLTALCALSQSSKGGQRYGYGLPATGSAKPAYAIFTNPAEDCATSMNVSWASPVGKDCIVDLRDESTKKRYRFSVHEPTKCETFDSIYSRVCTGQDVYERHVFDKHNVELFNLRPNTNYTYRIVTYNDATKKMEYSDEHRFRTAGASSWKAAVISDFHHYSPIWSRLDSAMGMLDVLDSVSGGFDWVLTPGDENAWGASFNYWTELAEQPNYKKYMWAGVQGNHDNSTRENVRSDAFYRDSHYYPHNGYAGQEGVAYWFKYGDALFLMLNNEAMHSEASLIPVFNWMRKVVKENPSKYIVVVEHYQWVMGTNGASSQLDRFRHVFDELGVDLAIAGNNHAYVRTEALRDRQPVTPEEGTYYVVAPSSDNNRGRELKQLAANEDIIATRWSEGPHTVGGMLMDVNPERIVMTLYNRYGEAQDTFTVPAKR